MTEEEKVHMDELKATNETLSGKLEYQNFNLDELNKKYLRLANRYKEVKSRLAKAHKELNQTNWISVKDKLPIVEKDVLVWCKFNDGDSHADIGYLTQSGEFHVYSASDLNITYWMPLPDPPK